MYIRFQSNALEFSICQMQQCLDKHVEQNDGRKTNCWEAVLEGRIMIRKELACLQHGVLWLQIGLPVSTLKSWPNLKNPKLVSDRSESSDRSENDKQQFQILQQTLRWGDPSWKLQSCALPFLLQLFNHFSKPPHWGLVCKTSHSGSNHSGSFVFQVRTIVCRLGACTLHL